MNPDQPLPPSASLRRARHALGTLIHIDLGHADGAAAEAEEAIATAFRRIEEIEQQLSYYRPDSELNRLHRHAARAPQTVSQITWEVLWHCHELATASAGQFDPSCIGALVREGLRPAPPGLSLLPEVQARWSDVELLPEQQVRFHRRLWLDLGGIAKGYAVDAALAVLQHNPVIHTATVNAGGDLRHFGPTPQALQVRHPAAPATLLPLGLLGNGAAATSAPYFRYSDGPLRGQPVSPLIDPQQQRHTLSHSVTVLADACWLADGLTKIVALQGSAADALLRHYHAEAAIIDASGNITASPGFWQRLGHPQAPSTTASA